MFVEKKGTLRNHRDGFTSKNYWAFSEHMEYKVQQRQHGKNPQQSYTTVQEVSQNMVPEKTDDYKCHNNHQDDYHDPDVRGECGHINVHR
jgi:hypothetical protein